MLAQNNYPADTLQHRLHPHLQPNESEEFKGSSETLIDGNGLPYATNSWHQTFTIASPTTSSLHGGLSIPLTKFSSKHSDDTSCEYPPVVSQPEVDMASFWQRVSAIVFPFCLHFSLALLDSARVHCLPFLCCDSPNRDRRRPCHRGRAVFEGTTNHASQWWIPEYCWRSCLFKNASVSEHLCTCPVSGINSVPSFILFINLNSVFQFVMAVGAVYARNTLQFLFLT